MKYPLIFSLCLLSVISNSSAQYLHTPSDFDKLIVQSTIRYTFDSTYSPALSQDFPLVEAGWRAVLSADSVRLVAPEIETQEHTLKYRLRGDNFFEKGKFLKAAEAYEKLVPDGGTDLSLLKRLADSYQRGGVPAKAAVWYQQAAAINYIDFEVHHQLAIAYRDIENAELAVKHITLAHLLNRNDPAILEALKEMYASNGKPFTDYNFRPVYRLESQASEQVLISYRGEPWKAYANCRAVWQFEPGYAKKMSHLSNAPLEEVMEKECLLNALIVYGRLAPEQQQQYPEFKALGFAIAQQRVNDFIMYEITARQEPLAVSKLSRQELLALAEFVQALRTL